MTVLGYIVYKISKSDSAVSLRRGCTLDNIISVKMDVKWSKGLKIMEHPGDQN